jgi:hypothetical protein
VGTLGRPGPACYCERRGTRFRLDCPLTFDNSGTLFAGDAQNAAIFALDLAGRPKGAPGAADVDGLDGKIWL